MPKITVAFTDNASIPDALKPFANGGNTVEIWAGDNVAAETNPSLEAAKNIILDEKKTVQKKYDDLLQSSSDSSRELLELRNKVASGTSATPEDLALVASVKAVLPTIKPDDLKKTLESVPALQNKLLTYETNQKNAELFKSSGFKNETVFMDLLGNKDKNPNLVETSVEAEVVNGQNVNKVFAKVKQADGTVAKMPLTDYVKANDGWKPYLSVLNGDGGTSTHEWLEQGGGGGNDDPTIPVGFDLDKIIADQNAKALAVPNPLFPKSAPASTGNGNAAVPQN